MEKIEKEKPESSPAEIIALHMFKTMGKQDYHKKFAMEWVGLAQQLIDTTGYETEELKAFINWAVNDNVSDLPAMNSVEYLAKALNPLSSLLKNCDSLLRFYSASKKVAGVTRKKEQKHLRPLSRDVASWLMLGPGVNQPLDGWTSARQKLDSIKFAWYGKDHANFDDPDIEWAWIFDEAQAKAAKSGISKEKLND